MVVVCVCVCMMMAAAAPREDVVPRPFRTFHVFGSRGCGKTALKKQWFDSAQSRVLSEIADVHIRIQVCGHTPSPPLRKELVFTT